jgi:hypothetical protein
MKILRLRTVERVSGGCPSLGAAQGMKTHAKTLIMLIAGAQGYSVHTPVRHGDEKASNAGARS